MAGLPLESGQCAGEFAKAATSHRPSCLVRTQVPIRSRSAGASCSPAMSTAVLLTTIAVSLPTRRMSCGSSSPCVPSSRPLNALAMKSRTAVRPWWNVPGSTTVASAVYWAANASASAAAHAAYMRCSTSRTGVVSMVVVMVVLPTGWSVGYTGAVARTRRSWPKIFPVVAKRLGEPPRAAVVRDLRVDHQGRVPWAVQPGPDLVKIIDCAHGDAGAAEAMCDRGDVGVRKADGGQVVAEVVDLGAVSGVVVDDDDHRQTQAHNRLQVGDAHVEPAIAQCRDRQPVRLRQGGADRGGQAEADRLERLRE